jgi:hypothetical protein
VDCRLKRLVIVAGSNDGTERNYCARRFAESAALPSAFA